MFMSKAFRNFFSGIIAVQDSAAEIMAVLASDGSDGDHLVVDGETPGRDMYYRRLIFPNGGANLKANQYRIHAQEIVGDPANPTLCIISSDGPNAVGTGATAGLAAGSLGPAPAGGAGGTAAGLNGGISAGAIQNPGAVIGDHCIAGGGGAGSGGAGGIPGAVTGSNGSTRGMPRGGVQSMAGMMWGNANLAVPTYGAGAGGGGGDTVAGGAGGAGGGGLFVMAGKASNITLRTRGGNGASPAGGNRGGGGGGGGGRVHGKFGVSVNVHIDVSGGVGAAGTGTGVAGVDGKPGVADIEAVAFSGFSRGVLIGDSIVDNSYDGPTSHFKVTGPRHVRAIAVSGQTISQQLTAWQASTGRGQPWVQWVVIMVGINNIRAGNNATTCVTEMNALIADIRANNPTAKILLCKMCPAKTHLDAINVAYFAQWQAFNANIVAAGTGGGNVDAVDLVITATQSDLDNGSGDFNASDDSGDFLHPSNAGELKITTAWHNGLVSLGL